MLFLGGYFALARPFFSPGIWWYTAVACWWCCICCVHVRAVLVVGVVLWSIGGVGASVGVGANVVVV